MCVWGGGCVHVCLCMCACMYVCVCIYRILSHRHDVIRSYFFYWVNLD